MLAKKDKFLQKLILRPICKSALITVGEIFWSAQTVVEIVCYGFGSERHRCLRCFAEKKTSSSTVASHIHPNINHINVEKVVAIHYRAPLTMQK